MKLIVSFLVALSVMIMMNMLNYFVLKFKIPDFFIGWVSCMGYYAAMAFYDEYKN